MTIAAFKRSFIHFWDRQKQSSTDEQPDLNLPFIALLAVRPTESCSAAIDSLRVSPNDVQYHWLLSAACLVHNDYSPHPSPPSSELNEHRPLDYQIVSPGSQTYP